MNRYFKKIFIAFSLIAVLLVCVSCVNRMIDKNDFGNSGYIVSGSEKLRPENIMKIGEFDVTLAEYRHHYLNTKYDMDGGNDDVWVKYPEYVPVLKNTVLNSLVELYSIRSLCKEAGIESDMQEIYDTIDEYKSEMSKSEFKEGLETHYLTESLYAYTLEGYQLYDSLFNHYFGEKGAKVMNDTEVVDYAEEYYMRAKYILIYPNTELSDSDYEAKLQMILDKAKRDEDFDELVKTYSNDKEMAEYGVYFTAKDMDGNFVSACRELEEGEVSDLVKTSAGYYIIKRLPIDAEHTQILRDIIYNRKYADMIENKIDTIAVELSDEYELIAPDTLK